MVLDSDNTTQLTAILTQRVADATRALKLFEHPGWSDVVEYLTTKRAAHEQTLRNPNVDDEARRRACWSLVIYDRVLHVQTHFDAQRKDAQRKLELLKHGKKTNAEVDQEILTLMR